MKFVQTHNSKIGDFKVHYIDTTHMGSKNGEKNNAAAKPQKNKNQEVRHRLHPDTKLSIWAIVFLGLSIVLILAGFGKAGPVGEWLFTILGTLFGVGYFLLPTTLIATAVVFLVSGKQRIVGITLLGAGLFILSSLGLIDIYDGRGGWLGVIFGSMKVPFGNIAAVVINIMILASSALIVLNLPIKITWPEKEAAALPLAVTGVSNETKDDKKAEKKKKDAEEEKNGEKDKKKEDIEPKVKEAEKLPVFKGMTAFTGKNYVPPPLTLLQSGTEKPTTGDLRANANIIKRTLESFGIPVDMGEINIGPKVTRYTLKPAEGV